MRTPVCKLPLRFAESEIASAGIQSRLSWTRDEVAVTGVFRDTRWDAFVTRGGMPSMTRGGKASPPQLTLESTAHTSDNASSCRQATKAGPPRSDPSSFTTTI